MLRASMNLSRTIESGRPMEQPRNSRDYRETRSRAVGEPFGLERVEFGEPRRARALLPGSQKKLAAARQKQAAARGWGSDVRSSKGPRPWGDKKTLIPSPSPGVPGEGSDFIPSFSRR